MLKSERQLIVTLLSSIFICTQFDYGNENIYALFLFLLNSLILILFIYEFHSKIERILTVVSFSEIG